MNPPKRWIEDAASATPFERDVLRAGLDLDPPSAAKASVWAALMTRVPPPGGAPPHAGGGAGGAGGGGGTAGAVGGGIVKSALIGAGSAIAVLAAYSAVAPSTPSTPVAVIASAEAPPAPVDARRGIGTAPAPSSSAAAAAASSSASSLATNAAMPSPKDSATRAASSAEAEGAADPESKLIEESQRVVEARRALRRGDAAGAITQLEELRRKFPGGGLGQEREALMIEALASSGRRAEAATRAEAFLKAYPTSPHATRVQAFTK